MTAGFLTNDILLPLYIIENRIQFAIFCNYTQAFDVFICSVFTSMLSINLYMVWLFIDCGRVISLRFKLPTNGQGNPGTQNVIQSHCERCLTVQKKKISCMTSVDLCVIAEGLKKGMVIVFTLLLNIAVSCRLC